MGGQWVAESAIVYRTMLNAFYAAVKSVDERDVVITAGTAPFGDSPGGPRVPPVAFDEQLLCLTGALAPAPCPDPAHFDVLAHDPYDLGAPTQPALAPGDVSLPDLGKLQRPLAVAERSGRALPAGHKPVWVTEFSYDTNPPNPAGVPMATAVRWVEQSMYVLWRQGVRTMIWLEVVDAPCIPSCTATVQSGVYSVSGAPKPVFYGYRFPFIATVGRRVRGWGIAPRSGVVRVQELSRRRWRTVAVFRASAHEVFAGRLTGVRRGAELRAVEGTLASPEWRS
jgi:hypothetical protein